MFVSFQNALRIMILLGAVMMIFGCSGGGNPVVPATDNQGNNDISQQDVYEGETEIGAFSLYLDPDSLTAAIEPVVRESAINVSNYVNVIIQGLHWDPTTRVWDIDVAVVNTTPISAYGPWVVFNIMRDKMLLNKDGFIWWVNEAGYPPERVPVKAFAKDKPQRMFAANSTEQFHLQIHWPIGTNSWEPIQFFVDVSFPGPRQMPIVENLKLEPTPIPEFYQVTAFVKDWQRPPPGHPGLDVWIDLSPIGFPPEQLFDDGQHGDGMPGDDIWGAQIMLIPDPGMPNCFTVHANDWEGFHFENDVCYHFPQPPECLPMEPIDEGQHGFPEPVEIVIRDSNTWMMYWHELHPGEPAPPVDFTLHQIVLVMLGERPSSGYGIHIDCVKEIGGPDGGPHTIVDYTEEIPGPDCEVLWIITSPYQIVMTPLTMDYDEDTFNHREHVYHCGGDCVPQLDLVIDVHSLIHNDKWDTINNPTNWWEFWRQHGSDIPEPPPVNFPDEMVIIGMLGDRPSTGWRVNIDCVKYIDDDTSDPIIIIEATEIEPGPNCPTEPIITQPHHFIAVPAFEGRIELRLDHIIDPCEEPDCVDFRVLDEGQHSLIHHPVEEMFKEPEQWYSFWEMHGPNTPAPEVFWDKEYVVALMTGERNTGGYWIRVDCVRLLEDPSYGRITQVEYTEMIPGPGCPVPDVITQPYKFIAVPQLFNSRPDFIKHEFVYDCPD